MNRSFIIVLMTIVINMMGVGMAWPIIPTLITELSQTSISNIALINGFVSTIYALMMFVFAPLLGGLSDRYGRRPIMLACLLALGIDNICLAFAPSVMWIFIGRALGGILAATNSISNAIVADQFSKKDRAKGFGYLGAAFGIGFILGPLMGGLLGEIDIRLPFFAAAAASLINFAMGYFFLEETNPKEKRNKDKVIQLNPFRAINILWSTSIILLISSVIFTMNIVQNGMVSIWVLYGQFQYGWGFKESGLSLTVVGLSYFVIQGFLVQHVVNKLGEVMTISLGMLLASCMFILLAFNTNGTIAYIGIVPYVLGFGCAMPAIQALASQYTDESSQGLLQGALTSMHSLAAIVGPAVAGACFSFFTSSKAPLVFPGFYFVFGAIIYFSIALLGFKFSRKNSASSNNNW